MKPPPGQNWQFRDQHVPARIIHLLKDGKITTTDLLLMFVIDSLVKPQTEEEGCGCYASNEFLACATGCSSPTYISNRLRYLSEDMSIVVIVRVNGRRFLELEWSRTAEELRAVEGDYGKVLRKALRRLRNNRSGSGKPEGAPSGKPEGGVLENQNINRTVEDISNSKGEGRSGRNARPPAEGLFRNGHDNTRRTKPVSAPPWCKELGNQILKVLRRNPPSRPVETGTTNSRTNHVYHLWKQMGGNSAAHQAIADRLALYEKRFVEITKPEITSVAQFCDPKIYNWLGRVLTELDESVTTERRDHWYEVAKQACAATSDYKISYNGRLREKVPGGGWRWIEEGEESATGAPDDAIGYCRHVRGEIDLDNLPENIKGTEVRADPDDDV